MSHAGYGQDACAAQYRACTCRAHTSIVKVGDFASHRAVTCPSGALRRTIDEVHGHDACAAQGGVHGWRNDIVAVSYKATYNLWQRMSTINEVGGHNARAAQLGVDSRRSDIILTKPARFDT